LFIQKVPLFIPLFPQILPLFFLLMILYFIILYSLPLFLWVYLQVLFVRFNLVFHCSFRLKFPIISPQVLNLRILFCNLLFMLYCYLFQFLHDDHPLRFLLKLIIHWLPILHPNEPYCGSLKANTALRLTHLLLLPHPMIPLPFVLFHVLSDPQSLGRTFTEYTCN